MAEVFWAKTRFWDTLYPGVQAADLHRYESGGGAALFTMEAGARIPWHGHATGEHVLVLEGNARFGSTEVSAGDALWVARGEEHSVLALTKVRFFASSLPKGA